MSSLAHRTRNPPIPRETATTKTELMREINGASESGAYICGEDPLELDTIDFGGEGWRLRGDWGDLWVPMPSTRIEHRGALL